jgi:hypothetical protein
VRAEVWALVREDAEVMAATEALEALEAEERRLTLELGKALRRAQLRAHEALEAQDRIKLGPDDDGRRWHYATEGSPILHSITNASRPPRATSNPDEVTCNRCRHLAGLDG